MSNLSDIHALVEASDLPAIHTGYAATGATVPYYVLRPLILGGGDPALSGDTIASDHQFTLYACGASVEASYNMALDLMALLQGARVGGSTLNTSMGYSGAPVEGHYESQVTAQLNQGGYTS